MLHHLSKSKAPVLIQRRLAPAALVKFAIARRAPNTVRFTVLPEPWFN
jgi:hypothetical protein